jgi:hypothetical protein
MVVTYELWDLETGNIIETLMSEEAALRAVSEYVDLEGAAYLDSLVVRPIREEGGERTWLPKIDGDRLRAKLDALNDPGKRIMVG